MSYQVRSIFDTGNTVILRRCRLEDKTCASNYAHAPAAEAAPGGVRSASEKKPDDEESCREVDTQARKAENREMLASRAAEYPTYIYKPVFAAAG